ncbi:holin [Clostridium perfringens]|uniref:holin n=1 Tax=Clostridium perfringens TaxID=1502 RepID=UPI0030D350E1
MVLQGFEINILPDNYQEIVKAILSILVLIGVINHPTSNYNEYSDYKDKNK